LPGVADTAEESFLHDWRNISGTTFLEPDVEEYGYDFSEAEILKQWPEKGREGGLFKFYDFQKNDIKYLPSNYAKEDLKIISLLYCDELKNGMDKNQIIKVLLQEKKCDLYEGLK
jgi:ATP-dependent RNA circularization protein (DNA/RNA ligase family)